MHGVSAVRTVLDLINIIMLVKSFKIGCASHAIEMKATRSKAGVGWWRSFWRFWAVDNFLLEIPLECSVSKAEIIDDRNRTRTGS